MSDCTMKIKHHYVDTEIREEPPRRDMRLISEEHTVVPFHNEYFIVLF